MVPRSGISAYAREIRHLTIIAENIIAWIYKNATPDMKLGEEKVSQPMMRRG
jgi:hypothetical protein